MIIRQHVTEFHLLQRSCVDGKRWVGGDGNVDRMQIIPYKSKDSPSLIVIITQEQFQYEVLDYKHQC